MAFFDGLKGLVTKWLGIIPANLNVSIQIRENVTAQVNILKNQLWYRGDPVELEQYFKQVAALDSTSLVPSTRFWAATPSGNPLVRKMHSGLPRMIADKLAQIVVDDMREAEGAQAEADEWLQIAKDVDFQELLKYAVAKTLSEGDGAFKISVDPTLSKYPLIEFFSGNDVSYTYKRGKLQEVQFTSNYNENTKQYALTEMYGRGYVRYKLMQGDKEVPLESVSDLADLKDVEFAGDYIMAVPLKFYKSAKFQDRGESIYEGKSDMFDAFDECISTWLDALRAGRVKQYIPENMIPRNPDNGELYRPDVFNPYIAKGTSLNEDEVAKIEVVQGNVAYDGYALSYTTLLDSCLQGIISPTTLGIDIKKKDNADAQREKEKATLYTRNTIIGILAKVLPKLADVVLKTQDNMNKAMPKDYELTFEWGEYANPSFETQVDTIGKAKVAGIMSIEQCVEELYGDSMDADDKAAEVARIKEEQNAATQVDEPSVNDKIDYGEIDASKVGGDNGDKSGV